MPLRPALLKDVGGTLTFHPQEIGTFGPEPVVDVFDGLGAKVVDNAAASLNSGVLSFAIDAAVCARLGENLRMRWTYVVSGITYRRDTTFDVVVAILYPTLTKTNELYAYYPLLEGREAPSSSTAQNLGQLAWEELVNRIRSLGRNPHQIIDPAPLEPIHAALWAAAIARNYRPGGPQSNEWQAFAAARLREAEERLKQLLSNLSWLDADDDLKPGADEQDVSVTDIRLSR